MLLVPWVTHGCNINCCRGLASYPQFIRSALPNFKAMVPCARLGAVNKPIRNRCHGLALIRNEFRAMRKLQVPKRSAMETKQATTAKADVQKRGVVRNRNSRK
jgi:hypothetical protein